jgi:hypothetical protein
MAHAEKIILLISQIVLDELADALQKVQEVLKSVPVKSIEYVDLTAEIIGLRDAYLKAKIVKAKWIGDATHVVAASAIGADAIVSWNFRHIVRVDRIGQYNSVNIGMGYKPLTIVTPIEVIRENEEED